MEIRIGRGNNLQKDAKRLPQGNRCKKNPKTRKKRGKNDRTKKRIADKGGKTKDQNREKLPIKRSKKRTN